MNLAQARRGLDEVMRKSRVHWYKPIQLAEILHRHRTVGPIDLLHLEDYRTASRAWRDAVCARILGRCSTSSSRFQDNLFEDNAVPPSALAVLGTENSAGDGLVEAYIYLKFEARLGQFQSAVSDLRQIDPGRLNVTALLNRFRSSPGLRRSVDKVYEIVVHVIVSAFIDTARVTVTVTATRPPGAAGAAFQQFLAVLLGVGNGATSRSKQGAVSRAGVTNAADRGLDMWANFGPAIQVKHLPLTQALTDQIMASVSSNEVVIVCKELAAGTSATELARSNSGRLIRILTEADIVRWYAELITQGTSAATDLRDRLLAGFQEEFPVCDPAAFPQFMSERTYSRERLMNTPWAV